MLWILKPHLEFQTFQIGNQQQVRPFLQDFVFKVSHIFTPVLFILLKLQIPGEKGMFTILHC